MILRLKLIARRRFSRMVLCLGELNQWLAGSCPMRLGGWERDWSVERWVGSSGAVGREVGGGPGRRDEKQG